MGGIKNRVQLIGRLAAKPEINRFESGKVKASFRMATNEYYKNAKGERVEETTWHNVSAWDKAASIIEKYTDKGSEIGIVGKLSSKSYDDKDGNKKYYTEVIADEVLLLGEKSTVES
ncbi:single-stranded DNA-binding protein [Belliella pelovolcani]|jgi:single-strand DNA-binding protein|uniref:Single-stranded DNA-binding protein n=1 Tax=Belliella pelovolcani TaxID=529505 RepID=A0A1N7LHH9_9BACT|nr:single-stranded DNA-binding protein [Belliella pelovolcani]SIS73221.1 single-strand binding protein [Belliella pelovolcani]